MGHFLSRSVVLWEVSSSRDTTIGVDTSEEIPCLFVLGVCDGVRDCRCFPVPPSFFSGVAALELDTDRYGRCVLVKTPKTFLPDFMIYDLNLWFK